MATIESAFEEFADAIHVAAVHAWLSSGEELPVNLKIFIEGEEETGSAHLPQFLEKYKPLLQADAMILTDTTNFDVGVPSLTVSLRGLAALDVEVRSLKNALHSGMWGGSVPDPVMALTKVLSQLTDDRGELLLPEATAEIRVLTPEEDAALEALPFDEKSFRDQTGLLDAVPLHFDGKPYASIWRRPSIAINAIQASSRKDARNILCDSAWARIGVRMVPNMKAETVLKALEEKMKASAPWGVEVTCRRVTQGNWWMTETDHPAFAAAKTALTKGYGCEPVMMGCGGSIPFVGPLSAAFGGIPALLIGVEDPYTNAHGENESLSLSDWDKAIKSAIYLYAELATCFGK